jgi:hypothetical protein
MNKMAPPASVPRQFDRVPCESGQRLKFRTQGSAKPPPWAILRRSFAAKNLLVLKVRQTAGLSPITASR